MTEIVLKDIRLAFPELYEARQYEGQGKHRYRAVGIIDPGSESLKLLNSTIETVGKLKWADKWPMMKAQFNNNSMKNCLIDGNLKANLTGYANNFVITANRNQEAGLPFVVDRNPKIAIPQGSGKIYSGCRVNMKVDIWAQGPQNAGIRATLVGVQFVSDDESFGGTAPASVSGMDDLGYEEGDDIDI